MSISLMGLMLVVIVIACGLAALKDPSELTSSLVFTAAVSLLVVATIGTWLGRRASWAGFAAFGWAALFLAFGSRPDAPLPPRPLTTFLLHQAFLRTGTKPVPSLGGLGQAPPSPPLTVALTSIGGAMVPVPMHYLQVGHSLLALVIACLGAVAG